jgi:hypothetical protein
LHRIDAVLAPTKADVLAKNTQFRGKIAEDTLDRQLRWAVTLPFTTAIGRLMEKLLA